ncbi:MAG: hypothetical protein WKF68_14345 [Daejeonella sp.]
MKIDFAELIKDLKDDIMALARKTLTERIKEAQDDAEYILDFAKINLEKWTEELADGRLDRDDFEYHLKSQRDLLSLAALKQAGISKVRIDKFKEEVFIIITSGILKATGIS